MRQRTPLYEQHLERDARIVDFGGWDMPLHYGSQLEEHHAVRRDAGMFDVSHMNVVDVHGAEAAPFLRRLLANDIARLRAPGKALYSCMLNEDGGVIDDLIVYFLDPERYRLILNAATRERDLEWIAAQTAGFDVSVKAHTDTAMIAVQGPDARSRTLSCLPASARAAVESLDPFCATEQDDCFVARTGYTGEDGFEIVVDADRAAALWNALGDAGVVPAGLGARDTLRLEAGMHLYGKDMDESTLPTDSGLGWTISFDDDSRDFIGRGALRDAAGDRAPRRFAGLLLDDRGVLRDGLRVILAEAGEGRITSGGYSPTLGRSIALARLPAGDDAEAQVEVRNRMLNVRIVDLPFVRRGRVLVDVGQREHAHDESDRGEKR